MFGLPPDDAEYEAFSQRIKNQTDTPEQALFAHIMAVALSDATVPDNRPGRNDGSGARNKALERDRALAWIESDSPHPTGFLSCCHILNLEPECVRSQVRDRPATVYNRLHETHRPRADRGAPRTAA